MAYDRGSLLWDLGQLMRLGPSGYGDLKEGVPRPSDLKIRSFQDIFLYFLLLFSVFSSFDVFRFTFCHQFLFIYGFLEGKGEPRRMLCGAESSGKTLNELWTCSNS